MKKFLRLFSSSRICKNVLNPILTLQGLVQLAFVVFATISSAIGYFLIGGPLLGWGLIGFSAGLVISTIVYFGASYFAYSKTDTKKYLDKIKELEEELVNQAKEKDVITQTVENAQTEKLNQITQHYEEQINHLESELEELTKDVKKESTQLSRLVGSYNTLLKKNRILQETLTSDNLSSRRNILPKLRYAFPQVLECLKIGLEQYNGKDGIRCSMWLPSLVNPENKESPSDDVFDGVWDNSPAPNKRVSILKSETLIEYVLSTNKNCFFSSLEDLENELTDRWDKELWEQKPSRTPQELCKELKRLGIESGIVVPLPFNGQVVGVVKVQSTQKGALLKESIPFVVCTARVLGTMMQASTAADQILKGTSTK